jgi:DNA processing protein
MDDTKSNLSASAGSAQPASTDPSQDHAAPEPPSPQRARPGDGPSDADTDAGNDGWTSDGWNDDGWKGRRPELPARIAGALTPGEARRLAIAVNAAEIPRAAICRLCAHLDLWTGRASVVAPKAIAELLGVGVRAVAAARAASANAERIAELEEVRAGHLGANIVTRFDTDYPERMFDLALPPPVLYRLGELPAGPAVAIVGSRQPDIYGREVASLFGRELARAGAVVVSGFARGVDAAAHRGALEAEGGLTVAVLGCGLGVDYPRGHARLAREIAGRGALVTELPVGHGPRAHNFPVRNRIIAALAQTVLVVRAAARSGSLITARQALELGREVAAIPGRIFATGSEGPNGLIRVGALLAQHPDDLLATLHPPLIRAGSEPGGDEGSDGVDAASAASPGGTSTGDGAPPPDEPAQRLLAHLPPGESADAESLATASDLEIDAAMTALLELELGGWIRREAGGGYSRRL